MFNNKKVDETIIIVLSFCQAKKEIIIQNIYHTSTLSIHLLRSCKFINEIFILFIVNSVQKQSLRANNRALAINLERTKQELRMALEMNQELRREIQEKDMRIVTLERVSGLRNDEIEEEVLRRVEVVSPDM